MTKITLHFSTIDGIRKTHRYSTLAGAQRKAKNWVGAVDSTSGSYAVSSDGVVKVSCEGCTLAELFGEAPAKGQPTPGERFFVIATRGGYADPISHSTREAAEAAIKAMGDDGYEFGIQEYMYNELGDVVEAPCTARPVDYDTIPY